MQDWTAGRKTTDSWRLDSEENHFTLERHFIRSATDAFDRHRPAGQSRCIWSNDAVQPWFGETAVIRRESYSAPHETAAFGFCSAASSFSRLLSHFLQSLVFFLSGGSALTFNEHRFQQSPQTGPNCKATIGTEVLLDRNGISSMCSGMCRGPLWGARIFGAPTLEARFLQRHF